MQKTSHENLFLATFHLHETSIFNSSNILLQKVIYILEENTFLKSLLGYRENYKNNYSTQLEKDYVEMMLKYDQNEKLLKLNISQQKKIEKNVQYIKDICDDKNFKKIIDCAYNILINKENKFEKDIKEHALVLINSLK